MEILNFIFQDAKHFFGSVILIMVTGMAGAMITSGISPIIKISKVMKGADEE